MIARWIGVEAGRHCGRRNLATLGLVIAGCLDFLAPRLCEAARVTGAGAHLSRGQLVAKGGIASKPRDVVLIGFQGEEDVVLEEPPGEASAADPPDAETAKPAKAQRPVSALRGTAAVVSVQTAEVVPQNDKLYKKVMLAKDKARQDLGDLSESNSKLIKRMIEQGKEHFRQGDELLVESGRVDAAVLKVALGAFQDARRSFRKAREMLFPVHLVR